MSEQYLHSDTPSVPYQLRLLFIVPYRTTGQIFTNFSPSNSDKHTEGERWGSSSRRPASITWKSSFHPREQRRENGREQHYKRSSACWIQSWIYGLGLNPEAEQLSEASSSPGQQEMNGSGWRTSFIINRISSVLIPPLPSNLYIYETFTMF